MDTSITTVVNEIIPTLTHPADNGPIGVTLVDARNGLNELQCLTMFWTICHHWLKGSHFSFNCYRHQLLLIIRNRGKPASILHSKEGITQGDPLAVLLYGTALTPLVEHLRKDYLDILQPWCADDAAFIGPAKRNAQLLNQIIKYGPDFGYYPEPEKSWHICTPLEQ